MNRFLSQQLRGLPPYFGGKRKLLPWIMKELALVFPPDQWTSIIFLDAFMGGGSVSLAAKALGFKAILSNDWSKRSQVIGQALLNNQQQMLTREQVVQMASSPREEDFVRQNLCPSVFSNRHAEALDRIIAQVNRVLGSREAALWQLLLWHLACEFVCFPTSLGTSNRPYAEALDGLRSWEGINPKRYLDGSLDNLLLPVWAKLETKRKAINSSIYGGANVQFFQQDAVKFIQQNTGDVLYLDPPYPGTLAYERANRVLDTLLFQKVAESSNNEVSHFSQGVDALHSLLDAARHIPIWLLSYGNRCIELPELIVLVKQHAGNREVVGFAKQYQHLAHVSKNQNNQELLVIASVMAG
jgi:adenine-specific DNA methylase